MKPDPKLDGLLRQWSDRHAPDPTALHDGLRRRLAAERFLHVQDAAPRHAARPLTPWLAFAAILVVCGLLFLKPRGDAAAPTLAALTPAELAARAEVYRGVKELFGDRLTGLDLSSNRLQMNLAGNEPADARDPARPLLVRLAALESDGQGGWRPLWQKEIVTLPQEVLRVPSAGGAELLCWICPTPDGKLVVDAQWQNGSETDATHVVTPGRPGDLITIGSGIRACRIVQSIDWLPATERGGQSS